MKSEIKKVIITGGIFLLLTLGVIISVSAQTIGKTKTEEFKADFE